MDKKREKKLLALGIDILEILVNKMHCALHQ
jgi:hypothetical protein